MYINRIEASNFKSFDAISVDLRRFNVFVGSNASGKSNFIELFQFLRDIGDCGLENAVSMHGEAENLINAAVGAERPLRIAVRFQPVGGKVAGLAIAVAEYSVALGFHSDRGGVEVEHESIAFDLRESDAASCRLALHREDNRYAVAGAPDGTLGEKIRGAIADFIGDHAVDPNAIALEVPWFQAFCGVDGLAGAIATYDFDPKLSKRSVLAAGRAELEKTGKNLAVTLRRILQNPDERRRLVSLVSDLLPFVTDVTTANDGHSSIALSLHESFNSKSTVNSSSISDGSIHAIALIVALFFGKRTVIFIEEPERTIHPALIDKVVEMLRAASERKQIILTTHSREMMRHLQIEDLYLVTRDHDGFSQIRRPVDANSVRVFLENDLGLDDLMVHDFFGLNE